MTIEQIKKRKIKRLIVNDIIRTLPTLSTRFTDACLEKYYKLYWSKEYFLHQSVSNLIPHQDKLYHVEFLPPLTRGKVLQMQAMDQLELSFRAVKPEYELHNVVLVSYPQSHIRISETGAGN